jgi:hypothetical protein
VRGPLEKRPIEATQGGNLVKTSGGSVYSDPATQTFSTQLDGQDADLMLAYQIKTGGNIPPVTIIVGDDPTHVFPSEASDIKPLPFRCRNCGARVKEGHLNLPLVDQILACLCMIVFVRRDTAPARSSGEWQEYRNRWLKGRIRHQATAADRKS